MKKGKGIVRVMYVRGMKNRRAGSAKCVSFK
jgi:hypothetical protein